MDWFALIGMAMFLGGLEYFLDEGARHDWFVDMGVRIAFVVCITGGFIFFSRSFTQPKPLLDLSVFRNKNFTLSSIITFVIGMALYGLGYMIPVFLGQVREMNSIDWSYYDGYGYCDVFLCTIIGMVNSKF
jgi:DHA2 family multidrug resistance protein